MSKLVSTCTGIAVPPNKAVVGANAFAHESGIHQDGMLKHEETYEIMRPETVGARATLLVMGKHSGKHAFAARLAELGSPLDGDALLRAFERFKQLADKKKQIHDADLLALASSERAKAPAVWELDALQVSCGTIGMPTATVKLRGPEGKLVVEATVGTGPVDAAFKAVDKIVDLQVELIEYLVQGVTEGIDALGQVSVRVRPQAVSRAITAQLDEPRERTVHGHGADTDIVVASVKAYLAAMNRLLEQRSMDARVAEKRRTVATQEAAVQS
jgi:2-isopropylmalate synthase